MGPKSKKKPKDTMESKTEIESVTSQSEGEEETTVNQDPPLPTAVSVEAAQTDTGTAEDSQEIGSASEQPMVKIPAAQLKMMQDLINALQATNPILAAAAMATETPASTSQQTDSSRNKFNTKNLKIEKFNPESQKGLIDYGFGRWLEQFDRELSFEFKIQGVTPDEELKKMTLYRFMRGRAANYTRQMASTFVSYSYEQVTKKLRENYMRIMSREKKNGLIQWTKRKEGEEADEYMARLITIADSMPENY
jgi:hypothetical protein